MDYSKVPNGGYMTIAQIEKRVGNKKTSKSVKVAVSARRRSSGANIFLFKDVFSAGGQERIDLIKGGVGASSIVHFASLMGRSQVQVMEMLGLPRTTVLRKIKADADLAVDQAERVIGLSKLVGQVETMVKQSGDPAGFDAPQWVSQWLEQPNPAIGNRPPAELMDTVAGQDLVSTLLGQMQSGAYA